jgi:asparagine synthase (glutamine-hydrolysing)
MCGICGLWRFDGAPVSTQAIAAMSDRLAHRGPDGAGIHLDVALGLGHRRLAILDLSPAGHQPMSYGAGRWWITFNGEIYNFLELRTELEAKGHAFASDSDTEVILAAYAEWGVDCLLKFNGMWAFAIWDNQERTLWLARDRFGVKPLFYLRQPGRFAFASEIKAFLALPGFTSRLNLPVLKAELLDIHSQEGGPNCLLHDVYRLPAGHWLRVDAEGQVSVRRWWQTLDHLTAVPQRLEEQAERFRELFEDALPAAHAQRRSYRQLAQRRGWTPVRWYVPWQSWRDKGGERQAANWQRAFVATFPGTAVDERPLCRTGHSPSKRSPPPSLRSPLSKRWISWPPPAIMSSRWPTPPLANLWLIYQAQRQGGRCGDAGRARRRRAVGRLSALHHRRAVRRRLLAHPSPAATWNCWIFIAA